MRAELNAANGKNDGDPGRDSRYAEYNSMDSSGNPLNVASRVAWSHQLTADQAADYTVANIFSPEASFAWYGAGYGGSNDPNNANYSWPAYWGNRNSNNDTNNATVSGGLSAARQPGGVLQSAVVDSGAGIRCRRSWRRWFPSQRAAECCSPQHSAGWQFRFAGVAAGDRGPVNACPGRRKTEARAGCGLTIYSAFIARRRPARAIVSMQPSIPSAQLAGSGTAESPPPPVPATAPKFAFQAS